MRGARSSDPLLLPRVALILLLLLAGAGAAAADEDEEAAFPFEAAPTDLILRGEPGDPTAVVRVEMLRGLSGPGELILSDAAGAPLHRVAIEAESSGRVLRLPVPMPPEGVALAFEVRLTEGSAIHRREVTVPRPDPDWVLHFIPGFHYDPVWWNTQEHYTETGHYMDAHVGPGIELVGEYLDTLRDDPDLTVAFHQLPYLKSFLEARPWRREELLEAVRAGRAGIVGGTYNELSSTLVSAEAVVRNAAYGTLWQREVLGGSGDVFWQCDVFGHDPSFPSLMRASGHRAGVFGRGPFHQWGIDRDRVNFPSEFLWTAPDGSSILTHYLTGHYGYAYAAFASGSNRAPDDRERTRAIIAGMFEDLKQPTVTHQVLLPMHTDFIRPLQNLGEIVRDWNEAYLAPRAIVGDSTRFFDAVEAEIEERGIVLPRITRDMNPIYTGCGVSFSDLKIAEREVETTLREAEAFATLAAIEGATYPHRLMDRAWRQLLFHAHHDAVTGSSSDQVYIDLLWGIRDAWEIATEVRFAALCHLASLVAGEGPLLWNPLPQPVEGSWIADDVRGGRRVVHAGALPPLGVRRLEALPIPEVAAEGSPDRPVLENEHLRVTIDLDRAGTITSILDLATGEELLSGPANTVVLVDEYPVLPGHGEGPWHLAPTGRERRGDNGRARLRRDPEHPWSIEVETRCSEYDLVQRIDLLPGSRRIDCTTRVERWRGRNQLLRVEFPFDLPGARPIYQTHGGVIGRTFSRDVDTAEDSWTLDQVTGTWVGLGAAATITVVPPDRPPLRRAIGVGEIVVPAAASRARLEEANALAVALVKLGVTTTITRSDARRYGNLEEDSNLPDFRLFLGDADELTAMGSARAFGLDHHAPIVFVEPLGRESEASIGLDMPTLWVRADPLSLDSLHRSLRDQSTILVPSEATRLDERLPSLVERGVAIVNEGVVSCRVEEEGVIGLNLMRSCTSWPSGIWIDPPAREHPDGSPLGAMHGTHEFRYSVIPHRGDHREAGIAARAESVQAPPLRQLFREGSGAVPDGHSWLSVQPAGVILQALKPLGFDLARWDEAEADAPRGAVVVRVWNGTGAPTVARIRPGFEVSSALRTDLLESAGVDLPITLEGGIELAMETNAFATLLLRLAPEAGDATAGARTPLASPLLEDAISAPWLENRGEGVDGNGIVSLAPESRELVLSEGAAETTLHILNGHRSQPMRISLTPRGPEALEVELLPPLVEVPAGERVAVRLSVRAREAWSGRAAIELSAALPRGSLLGAVWVRDAATPADEPVLEWVVEEPIAAPRGELKARLRNLTDGPLRGIAAWITPQPAWEAVGRWREEVDLLPRGEVELVCRISSPIDSYAIPRFTGAGEIAYGPPIAMLAERSQVILAFEGDRVRIPESGDGVAVLTARARGGLSESSAFELEAPSGWKVAEIGRSFTAGAGEGSVQELEIRYAVGAEEGRGSGGVLVARGEGRSHAMVDATVAPAQRALAGGGEVVIDGDLSDWGPEEFTEARGSLGAVRTAVRYDTGGLFCAMDVDDTKFRQIHAAATIWEGDSVQIALTAAPGTEMGYSSSDLEFGAALTPQGPLVWCWYAGPGGRTGRVEEAEVAVIPHAQGIRYEFRIPRTRLPGINLEPGGVLGFSYIANDDDGEGYAGATEWTGGMTGTKDSSQFGELLLIPR